MKPVWVGDTAFRKQWTRGCESQPQQGVRRFRGSAPGAQASGLPDSRREEKSKWLFALLFAGRASATSTTDEACNSFHHGGGVRAAAAGDVVCPAVRHPGAKHRRAAGERRRRVRREQLRRDV